jgi:hypothetical protein
VRTAASAPTGSWRYEPTQRKFPIKVVLIIDVAELLLAIAIIIELLR